jgi:hypothetical protein
VNDLDRLESPAFVEIGAQRSAPDEFHHEGFDAIVVTGIEDGDDRGMGEARRGHRFSMESGAQGGIVGDMGVKDLHGDGPTENHVGRRPHLGHAAVGQMGVESIATGQNL